MQQNSTDLQVIYVISTCILLVIIIGIIIFIFQYRKRKIEYVEEKRNTQMKHHTELQEATLEMQQLTMQDIGREIHDGVGQRLTLASIYTKQLLGKDISAETKQKAEEINTIINESLGQLRSLSKELTNENNHEVDLGKLINEEVKKIADLAICNIDFVYNNDSFINNKKAMFIVRILQEFLQNSLKHADCKNIAVHLHKTESELILNLKDDGKGFDTATLSKGIGLQNMKRRAEMIDASLHINSVIGKGTSLLLKLNLY